MLNSEVARLLSAQIAEIRNLLRDQEIIVCLDSRARNLFSAFISALNCVKMRSPS